jgi:hypothetical protein
MVACNGVLFNHESPRRGETFVTRKITRGLARVDAGLDDCLYMGNLDSLRDWGHPRDTSSAGAFSGSIPCSARSARKRKTGVGRTWPAFASRRPRRNGASGLQCPAKTCSSSSLTACSPEWFRLAPQSREAASSSQRAIESTSWLRPDSAQRAARTAWKTKSSSVISAEIPLPPRNITAQEIDVRLLASLKGCALAIATIRTAARAKRSSSPLYAQ